MGESKANPDVKLSTLTIKVRKARQDAVLAGSPHLHLDAELLREVMRDPVRLSKVAAVIRAAGL